MKNDREAHYITRDVDDSKEVVYIVCWNYLSSYIDPLMIPLEISNGTHLR